MRKEIYFHRNINLLQNIILVFQLLIKYIGGGTCPSYQEITTGLLPLKVNLIPSYHNDCLFWLNFYLYEESIPKKKVLKVLETISKITGLSHKSLATHNPDKMC